MKTRNFLKSIFTMTILMLLFLGFVCFSDVNATTYYVSPTGSDSNSGSVGSPFRTIQKAANIVSPGDTVIVKNGTYTDTDGDGFIVKVMRGGTSSNWVKFKAENKWGAVVDGKDYSTGICWVFSQYANYVRVEDFEIKGCRSGGFWSNDLADYVYMYRNNIHHIGHRIDCNMSCCSGACTCGNAGAYQGKGTNHHTYDSNIFSNIGRLPSGGCTDIYYNHDHGIYTNGNNTKIINNIFYDLAAGWAIALSDGADYFDIINNTFYGENPGRTGHIHFDSGNSNTNIINNISHSPKGVFIQNGSPGNDDSGNIKNNLVYGASLSDPGLCNYLTCGGNITGQDPKFEDSENHNFHIQSGSPAIDKGLAFSGRTKDADGNAIVGAPDIGAYEAGGVSEDTIPPAPPAIIEVK